MLPLTIARRFIVTNRSQTIFIVVGIAVGVAVQMFIGLLIDSLQAGLIQRTLGSSAQITVTSSQGVIPNAPALVNHLQTLPEVKAVLPVTDVRATLGSDTALPVLVRGVSAAAYGSLYQLRNHLISGKLPDTTGEVALGKQLVEATGLKLGAPAVLTTAHGGQLKVTVVGTYDLGDTLTNNYWLFTTPATAQQLAGSDAVTSLEVQITPIFQADTLAKTKVLPIVQQVPGVVVTNWKEENPQLFNLLQGQAGANYLIQIIVLFSLFVAISSVLTVSVVQKSAEVGILKAIGLHEQKASRIFVAQGAILGFLGTVIGTLLGFAAFYLFVHGVHTADGNPVVVPVVRWVYVGGTIAGALLISVLAGWWPARRSVRLNPIDHIRSH